MFCHGLHNINQCRCVFCLRSCLRRLVMLGYFLLGCAICCVSSHEDVCGNGDPDTKHEHCQSLEGTPQDRTTNAPVASNTATQTKRGNRTPETAPRTTTHGVPGAHIKPEPDPPHPGTRPNQTTTQPPNHSKSYKHKHKPEAPNRHPNPKSQ